MESLSVSEPAQQHQQHQHQQPPQSSSGPGPMLGPGAGPQGSQGPPQLPPQMFTTAAQLLDLTDKKLMVALRDGRKLIGVLRSWDQFANLVLQSTTERIFVTSPPTASSPQPRHLYADVPRGIFLVRGENVLLLGEIDLDKEDVPPAGYEVGDVEEVHRLAKAEKIARERKDKQRLRLLKNEGFEGENVGEVLLL